MCHQKEGAPQSKYKKATLIDIEGRIFFPVKVVEPVEKDGNFEIIRVYGNPKIVPNGAAWLRFKAVHGSNGQQVL